MDKLPWFWINLHLHQLGSMNPIFHFFKNNYVVSIPLFLNYVACIWIICFVIILYKNVTLNYPSWYYYVLSWSDKSISTFVSDYEISDCTSILNDVFIHNIRLFFIRNITFCYCFLSTTLVIRYVRSLFSGQSIITGRVIIVLLILFLYLNRLLNTVLIILKPRTYFCKKILYTDIDFFPFL